MIVLKHILVPIDFEQDSLHAMSYGRELARQFAATVHLLHVVSDVFALRGGTEGALTAFPQLQGNFEEMARRRHDGHHRASNNTDSAAWGST